MVIIVVKPEILVVLVGHTQSSVVILVGNGIIQWEMIMTSWWLLDWYICLMTLITVLIFYDSLFFNGSVVLSHIK